MSLHLKSGCDTVSVFRELGKLAFKIFDAYHDLYEHTRVFQESNISIEDIVNNGIQIYLAKHNANLSFPKPVS